MQRIPLFYHPNQVHDANSFSKSPQKPSMIMGSLVRYDHIGEHFKPMTDLISPVEKARLKLTHDAKHVDDLVAGTAADGFGNASKADNKAIRYTVGNFLVAAEWALKQEGRIAWSLTSGFHHAGRSHCGGLCTYEALTLSAFELHKFHDARTLIWDEDAHFGNGCVEMIGIHNMHGYCRYVQSEHTHNATVCDLVAYRQHLRKAIAEFKPDIIMYQAGADNWQGDGLGGGQLDFAELFERDVITFEEAKLASVAVVCNLAGGYAPNFEHTLAIHLNTAEAMKQVYLGIPGKRVL